MAELRDKVRVGIRINPQIGAGKFLRYSQHKCEMWGAS